MSCPKCREALPYLVGFPTVAVSQSRHGLLYQCPNCHTYYEQIGEEWVGPDEVTREHVACHYPSVLGSTAGDTPVGYGSRAIFDHKMNMARGRMMGSGSRPLVRLLIVGAVTVSLLLLFARFACSDGAPSPPNAAQLRDVERLMEVKLSPSARPVAWTYDSWLDYGIFLKVEIDAADLQSLVQQSPFASMTLGSNEHNFYDGLGESWWDIGAKAQRFLFGEILLPVGQQYPDRRLQMLVDMDNEQVYVVYLALHST